MNEEKNTWLKYVVGAGASFLGLQVINVSGGVCNSLADAHWPHDFRSMVIAANHCEGGAYLYVGAAFAVSYYLCSYLTNKRRPIIGACVGLAAGVFAAALAAKFYFYHLYG